ncbi:hypothetical protein MJT46_008334 [Ovis ammon polii x Ovis aries]|nr:hypothetical protein MJT46_008334 [Ovis ammon polii x Ovis aries]
MGKPRGKDTRENLRCFDPRGGLRDTAATALEESASACPHSRRGLTPLGRLQKYPKIHVSTGEESSGSGPEFTQGLRPRHQRERNSERPPRNSHGDWPFLRPPERVPEGPVPRIDSHHVCTWDSPVESLVGKPRGKDTRENHRCFDPRGGLRDTAATALEESASACPHSRRGLTPLGRLQKYPKIHVSTGEESSGSGPEFTQGLRPRHQRERNSERPPRNSHGDWPFLRPPERVPEGPVPRIDSHHVCTWDSPVESLVGKPRGKDTRENHRCFDPRGGLRDTAATALEESASACPHSRRGLTPLGRLQKYPKIHVSTGEESSGSGPEFTQGLRPRHQRERNSERPPRNSHGDWPFLRPPERVPEGPVPRIDSHHVCTWDSPVESLVGKPRGKDTRENHRCFDPRGGLRDTAATALEESASACPHSRRGLTPLGRLQKYPKIHVSTGEESSGSGPEFTQGLRPRHQRERNSERPPRNSHGDWPFLRPPERVPEGPVPRIDSHHVCTWDSPVESLVGKPRGKDTRENHRCFDPRGGLRDTAATALEESASACPHSRRGLTPLGRLQKYPKIHVSTGEESSGSGPEFTQGLRPRHQRERNSERPPRNSHGDWPFLRPPERVPEGPVPRIDSHHVCTWDSPVESLVGKPRGKDTRENHRCFDPRGGLRDTAATALEESASACPHSRRGLTPLGRLQKYPKIHVSTGEESSGSGPEFTQGLRPRHQRERNSERPPRNSHGDWPFLRPPERVPEGPVPRIDSHHVCTWDSPVESLVGKPRGKDTRENHRCFDPRGGLRDTAATALEESASACPHSRRGLTPLGRLQKYPKIHVSTGEESSGSGPEFTQGLRPRHQRERNSERPPRNSHGDWPFLRPPEQVPEGPVPRIDSHHVCTWDSPVESLVGKPRGKDTRENHRCFDPRGGLRDTAATALEESASACPHSRRGLTPLGRLQKYPKIHVSTGEESSGSGPEFTQGLRPRHQRERNSERPPRNSHGDWPFLRPPERVPEGPVPRIDSHHVCTWDSPVESLVGKPRGKDTRENHRCFDPRGGLRDTAATALEESASACPHSRRGLTPLGRLQKYPKIHVSTGEESSGSGPEFTQGLRPRHQRERNSERPPRNSHGDWPFLRPPERVPEGPVPRIDSHHVCTWDSPVESLVGKPRGKDTRENHRCFDPRGGLRDTAATALEESASACPHSRRGLTPLGRLQKYPKIHVSTGEESSGSGPEFTQGLRPRHQRERNSERPPRNSHGDWPFLRPPERVPEGPVPRIDSHHVCTWDSPVESLVGKPRGKDTRENHRCFDPRGRLRDTAATALEESASACPHSRRGLTPLGRLQKYPKIHVSTGEESSGSGPEFTQGLRPRHQRERNSERPPRNSHGDWPFLRPPERVPEGPVPRIDSHHVCTWDSPVESLVGKPRGKDTRENHRCFDPRGGLRDTAATALEESASACPHSRRGLTPLGRLQKYPKIHVSTGEESSGSGPEFTQGLRPRHQRERNSERPPRNSHGDWPFLRPPERVPEGPVPRIDSHHVCTWDSPVESLVGKPRGKDTRENHRCFDPRGRLRDTAATALEESASACPHSRRGLTPLGRLQKYPKIHVSTGEESSGSGPEFTQGLRPRHQRERNSERPPRNSHGDWPFLRPPERVPEGPVPRIDSHHVCTWDSPVESLVGKPRGKDTRENHRCFDPRGGLRDTAATALEESASACPHSRRGLTPLGRLQKYPKIHVSTGEESSGSGPEFTQGLRPRHQRERNSKRPPRNSHGDWPFLRPPERVPEGPVGKNSRRSRRISRGGALHRKGERNSRVVPPFQESPRCVSPFQRNLFSLHCLDVQAEDRLPPRVHVGQPCGKASWESLVGKTRRKTIDALIHGADCVTLLLPLWRKAQVHARIRDED